MAKKKTVKQKKTTKPKTKARKHNPARKVTRARKPAPRADMEATEKVIDLPAKSGFEMDVPGSNTDV